MIYFLYSETFHQKDAEKGIYHYTLYKDVFTHQVYSESNIIPFLTAAEFMMSPIMAALQYILKKRRFQKDDQIRIMYKDGIIGQIVNLKKHHNQCPLFVSFWNNAFKSYQKCVVAFKIYPLIHYDYFKINPNVLYQREQYQIEKLKNMLPAS